jgi:hypothetical protein
VWSPCFNDRQLDDIKARLEELAGNFAFVDVPVEDARDAHWVTPSLVGEVTYGETHTSRGRPASAHRTPFGCGDCGPDKITKIEVVLGIALPARSEVKIKPLRSRSCGSPGQLLALRLMAGAGSWHCGLGHDV